MKASALSHAVPLIAFMLVPLAAQAQSTPEEIARSLANPNGTLGFLNFPLDFVSYDGSATGAGDQSTWRLNAQPSFPYPLTESTNLFFRPLIPIVFQHPVSDGSGSLTNAGPGLGDIGYDLALGTSLENGLVLFAGAVGSLPTGSEDLGSKQWRLGPEAYVGLNTSWGHVGGLFTHQWRVGGSNDTPSSTTSGQYFYNIDLGGGWQIQAQPTWSFDHEASRGSRLTLPLGTGLARTTIAGSTPLKLSVQYWYYIESPDFFGPDHQIRFTATPVVALPW